MAGAVEGWPGYPASAEMGARGSSWDLLRTFSVGRPPDAAPHDRRARDVQPTALLGRRTAQKATGAVVCSWGAVSGGVVVCAQPMRPLPEWPGAGRSADRAGPSLCCGRSAGVALAPPSPASARRAPGKFCARRRVTTEETCSAKRRALTSRARAAPIGTADAYSAALLVGAGATLCCRRAAGHRRVGMLPARTRCAGRAAGGGGDAGRYLLDRVSQFV